MIDAFLNIIDRIIKLKEDREARVEKRFSSFFEPIYSELLFVHKDYVDIFSKLYSILGDDYFYDDGETKKEKYLLAAKYLKERRRELEPVRIKLQALSKQLINTSLTPKENQFLLEVQRYLFPIKRSDEGVGILSINITRSTQLVRFIDEHLDSAKYDNWGEEEFSNALSFVSQGVQEAY